jgi:hypothetical protein
MYYDERIREWKQQFEPSQCFRRCNGTFCSIKQREINKKKGNVFYDLKTSTIRHDGTLFDGEEIVSITKDIRYFEHPVSLDICNDFVKLQSDEVRRKYYWNHASTIQIYDKNFKFEILNIRAETRPSRDLMQDLEDIKAGISIEHESDRLTREKANKKQRREEAERKKIEKLERKIHEIGYFNLQAGSLDKVHADKWLGKARIAQLEAERKNKLKQVQEKPVQMELFDFIGEAK